MKGSSTIAHPYTRGQQSNPHETSLENVGKLWNKSSSGKLQLKKCIPVGKIITGNGAGLGGTIKLSRDQI